MCRLALRSANEPISPYKILEAMEAMKEGYDGSGVGILLRGVSLADYNYRPTDPILSGIAHTKEALHRLNELLQGWGFSKRYDHDFEVDSAGIEAKDRYKYLLRVYTMPVQWHRFDKDEVKRRLMLTRLNLRKNGEEHGGDLSIFSFWPDVVMIKEVGWPLEIGTALGLDDNRIKARVVMAQGRQNTNWDINLYACHPFFLQGIATMTNGENTAFIPIRDWLIGRGFPGYDGYMSDSEVFTHILHYVVDQLKLSIEAYKHVITPLKPEELKEHPQGEFLRGLRNACRRLVIDGPNCVMGSMPDETCLMVMDHKKLRPGIIGGKPGEWAMASEMSGVDAMIPDRDRSLDFQPMREHTVLIPPDRRAFKVVSQFDPFPLPQAV